MTASPKHILVIGNEPLGMDDVRTVLEQESYEVTSTESAHEGLRLAAETSPDMVIVMTILKLQDGLTGVHVVARLRADYPTLPIMLMSASMDLRQIAPKTAATTWMFRPFRSQDLLRRVQKLLQ